MHFHTTLDALEMRNRNKKNEKSFCICIHGMCNDIDIAYINFELQKRDACHSVVVVVDDTIIPKMIP